MIVKTKNSKELPKMKIGDWVPVVDVEGKFTLADGPHFGDNDSVWALLSCGDDSTYEATYDDSRDAWIPNVPA